MAKKIFGHIFNFNQPPSVNESNPYYRPIKVGKRTRYYLGKRYPGVYFTSQEAKCMYYFLSEFTDKKVAKYMNICPRTVTYYSLNMQCKIFSKSKKEMIAKIK